MHESFAGYRVLPFGQQVVFKRRIISVALLALSVAALLAVFVLRSGSTPNNSFIAKRPGNQVAVHLIFANNGASPVVQHYTEHLTWLNAFGGARDADRHTNAWTSDIAVGYWLSGAKSDLPDLLSSLGAVFREIELSEEFALQERDIVMREYELRMSSNADARAIESMDAFLYEGNAIAASVIGTPDTIEALDYDDARKVHAKTHIPQNARLVVIGDVSGRELRRALETANWPDLAADTPIVPPPFTFRSSDQKKFLFPEPNAGSRLIWRRLVTLPEPVSFELLDTQVTLLRDLLDTNLPGGLAGPLRFDAAIARSFNISLWPIDEDTVELSFVAEPDKEVTLATVQAAYEAALAETAKNGIPETTFTRVLSRFEGFWPNWDDSEETGVWMAEHVLDRVSNLREPISISDLMKLHDELSLEMTNQLLRQIASDGRTATAFIGPEDAF